MNIRIRMLRTVRPAVEGAPAETILRKDNLYNAITYSNGAVYGICKNGEQIEVYHDEFVVIDTEKLGRSYIS